MASVSIATCNFTSTPAPQLAFSGRCSGRCCIKTLLVIAASSEGYSHFKSRLLVITGWLWKGCAVMRGWCDFLLVFFSLFNACFRTVCATDLGLF